MPDCVVDATVVYMSNGNIAARRPGNVFDRRLKILEEIGEGLRRLRYNPKLLHEYQRLIENPRNDVIQLFFEVLAESGVIVPGNRLPRHHYDTATRRCRWPAHDQHLLAAAIGGLRPSIFVTEQTHANCAACILRNFAVRVEHLV